MMRSSSRTVERSRFRRKRIRRRREFQASDIKCTSLDSKGAKPRLNSLGSGTQGPLVQYSCHGHQRGDGPPENETHFQRQLWDAETASEPCEALPYEGGAEDAEEPTCGGDQPEPEVAVRSGGTLLRAEVHAQLGAGDQIVRHAYRHGPECVQSVLRCRGFARAIRTFGQMLA